MSAEHTDQIAPRLAQARKATAAAGTLGRKATTRSPGSTPIASSAAASAPTWRRSSGQAISSERPAACMSLVAKDHRRMTRGVRCLGVPKDLLRVVHLRPGKPHRAGHLLFDEHRLVRRRRDDLEVVPDRLPEGAQIGARPAPEAVVAIGRGRIEAEPVPLAQPAGVAKDVRLGHAVDAASGQRLGAPLAVDLDEMPRLVPEERLPVPGDPGHEKSL